MPTTSADTARLRARLHHGKPAPKRWNARHRAQHAPAKGIGVGQHGPNVELPEHKGRWSATSDHPSGGGKQGRASAKAGRKSRKATS